MSGAIQVAILNTLDGSRGIAGWRYAVTLRDFAVYTEIMLITEDLGGCS